MVQYKGISIDSEIVAKGKALEAHLRCASFSHMIRRLIEDRFEAEHLQLTPAPQEAPDAAATH